MELARYADPILHLTSSRKLEDKSQLDKYFQNKHLESGKPVLNFEQKGEKSTYLVPGISDSVSVSSQERVELMMERRMDGKNKIQNHPRQRLMERRWNGRYG